MGNFTLGNKSPFFIKNINDDDNIVGQYVTDPSSGLYTNVFTIEPRTYGLALGYNFN